MTTDGPSLVDLAEDWLRAKELAASTDQVAKGHSARARRNDLARWGRLLAHVRGVDIDWDSPLSLLELDAVTVRELSVERLEFALSAARTRFADATVERMLSTLRGFTLWLTRRGFLGSDPCVEPTLKFSGRNTRRPKGLTTSELDELRKVAASEPPEGSRRFWPARDRCVIEFLVGTGARTSELCKATVGDIDWSMERPILRIDNAKGNKNRDIPLGATTVLALNDWLVELAQFRQTRPELLGAAPLFIQNTGQPATTGWLDQLLRALARRAHITLPVGASAHAFRHTYGLTAAMRGVPTNVLTQLLGHEDPRTTAIYTTATARSLISALDDAGLLD